ncbi:MAG: carbohydrate ABC transporter permease [Peptoniphilus sp.]|nr:carbohydrate ABC transporter permease [Peptoniphilus sp.]MDD7363021.1 carbohydrate ABC transporter permease [Bacillota bacterium]MDY6045286.1 carbohydrate ABC transporter permease [Peptoniphilus sp.]
MKTTRKNQILYVLAVILFLILTLGPLLWLLSLSLTEETSILTRDGGIVPAHIYGGNYARLFDPASKEHALVFGALKNSLFAVLMTLGLGLPISYLSAYAYARYRFKGRRFLLTALLISMVIPVFTTIIPIYAVYARFGLLDKLFFTALIYVSSLLPVNTWMMTNYLEQIPGELWEAARVDGCSERQIFFKLALPLSKPILAASALMIVLMAWNQYQIPLILTSSPAHKPITLVLSDFVGRDVISVGMIAASGIFAVLPPALLAVIFRKFLVQGILRGSVKG